ncbi:hypothetical protein OS189_16010 [Sulfitobacter sp. F26169L]|uniref:hypothetical protein n=1 Tax=Sulfitobacter sp. F26169L TaxID=2996015 RepID=UPI002260F8A0|nr:hypothetical protein [Sulfitobacter sp. F26169L]MCX7567850.1 hypothetical protein [Sulfitobacter sp. F26169L]
MDTASQSYLEHGLTDKTTIVANIGMARLRHSPSGGYATFSMRRALSAPDATSKWAYEVGVGAGWLGDEVLPHLHTGLSWGRGVTWGKKSGWATIEAAVIWDLTDALHLGKVDATFGINFTDVTAGMLQIYTAHTSEQHIATFAPSVIFSSKVSKFKIQIGTESQIGNLGNSAIKLGLWREF